MSTSDDNTVGDLDDFIKFLEGLFGLELRKQFDVSAFDREEVLHIVDVLFGFDASDRDEINSKFYQRVDDYQVSLVNHR